MTCQCDFIYDDIAVFFKTFAVIYCGYSLYFINKFLTRLNRKIGIMVCNFVQYLGLEPPSLTGEIFSLISPVFHFAIWLS